MNPPEARAVNFRHTLTMTNTRRAMLAAVSAVVLALIVLGVVGILTHRSSLSTAIDYCSQSTDTHVLGTLDWQGHGPFLGVNGTRQGSGLVPVAEPGPWTLFARPSGITATLATPHQTFVSTSKANIFDGAHYCVATTYDGAHMQLSIKRLS